RVRIDQNVLGARRYNHGQQMLAGVDQTLRFFDRLLDQACDLDWLFLEDDSALGNSSDVEQIVNKSGELIGLPARDTERAIAAAVIKLRSCDCVEHGREGVAKLMA